MSSPVSQLISVYANFNFDLDDISYSFLIENSPEVVVGFTAEVADKTARCFKEVNVSRSTVTVKGGNILPILRHEHFVWKNKGPFSSEQIMKMVQYKAGLSNDEWYEHMNNSGGVIALSSKK